MHRTSNLFSKEQAPVMVCVVLIIILILWNTGFASVFQESEICAAAVTETDNSQIIDTGLIQSGEQRCKLSFLYGSFKGLEAVGTNMLNGSLEQDKIFHQGDTALVRINYSDGKILSVSMIDHFRVPAELLLSGSFILLLVLFAGKTGLRAVISFVLTILMIWKLLVPFYLRG